jgi:hypothetical protein
MNIVYKPAMTAICIKGKWLWLTVKQWQYLFGKKEVKNKKSLAIK